MFRRLFATVINVTLVASVLAGMGPAVAADPLPAYDSSCTDPNSTINTWVATGHNWIRVSWDGVNCEPGGYRVWLWEKTNKAGTVKKVTVPMDRTTHVFHGLKPSTEYEAQVRYKPPRGPATSRSMEVDATTDSPLLAPAPVTTTTTTTVPITCTDNSVKIQDVAASVVSHHANVTWTPLNCPGDYVIRLLERAGALLYEQSSPKGSGSWTSGVLTPSTNYTVKVLYRHQPTSKPNKAGSVSFVSPAADLCASSDPLVKGRCLYEKVRDAADATAKTVAEKAYNAHLVAHFPVRPVMSVSARAAQSSVVFTVTATPPPVLPLPVTLEITASPTKTVEVVVPTTGSVEHTETNVQKEASAEIKSSPTYTVSASQRSSKAVVAPPAPTTTTTTTAPTVPVSEPTPVDPPEESWCAHELLEEYLRTKNPAHLDNCKLTVEQHKILSPPIIEMRASKCRFKGPKFSKDSTAPLICLIPYKFDLFINGTSTQIFLPNVTYDSETGKISFITGIWSWRTFTYDPSTTPIDNLVDNLYLQALTKFGAGIQKLCGACAYVIPDDNTKKKLLDPIKNAAKAVFATKKVIPEVSITGPTSVVEGDVIAYTIRVTPGAGEGAIGAGGLAVGVRLGQTGVFLGSAKSHTLNLWAGSSTFSVATVNDEAFEDDGSITATLQSGSGYTIVGGSATVTVFDDDCQFGKDDNGNCLAAPKPVVCSTGQVPDGNGGCKTKTCPTGKALNQNGDCVLVQGPCQAGMERVNGVCVVECSLGQVRDDLGVCVDSPACKVVTVPAVPAEYRYVNHPAKYQYVNHPAEYRTDKTWVPTTYKWVTSGYKNVQVRDKWVETTKQVRDKWVPAVYNYVDHPAEYTNRRVWVKTTYKTVVDVAGHYKTVTVVDKPGRWFTERLPGFYKTVVDVAGHYKTVSERYVVSKGYWKYNSHTHAPGPGDTGGSASDDDDDDDDDSGDSGNDNSPGNPWNHPDSTTDKNGNPKNDDDDDDDDGCPECEDDEVSDNGDNPDNDPSPPNNDDSPGNPWNHPDSTTDKNGNPKDDDDDDGNGSDAPTNDNSPGHPSNRSLSTTTRNGNTKNVSFSVPGSVRPGGLRFSGLVVSQHFHLDREWVPPKYGIRTKSKWVPTTYKKVWVPAKTIRTWIPSTYKTVKKWVKTTYKKVVDVAGHYVTKRVKVKDAWSEKVLVKAGFWTYKTVVSGGYWTYKTSRVPIREKVVDVAGHYVTKQVLVKAAWTEKVLVKAAWTEKILVKAAVPATTRKVCPKS